MRSFSFLLLLYLCIATGIWANDLEAQIESEKKELLELQQQLKKNRSELNKLTRSKKSALAELNRLNEAKKLELSLLKKMEILQAKLQESYQQSLGELNATQNKLNRQKLALVKRVRHLYMQSNTEEARGWELLFDTRIEMFKKVHLIKKAVSYDSLLVSQYLREKKNQELVLALSQKKQHELSVFESQKKEVLRAMETESGKLSKKINKLESDEQVKQRALREIEKNAKALQKIVQALEARRKQNETSQKKEQELRQTGPVCPPVNGKIVSNYGIQYHETLKTKTKNLGVEIQGSPGEQVKSAVDGEVVYVDQIPGYGRGVIVYNGSGYYTIYGNLQSIRVGVGQKVKTCGEIAVIPQGAGNLEGKIYFEVRKEKTSIDPLRWLRTFK